MALESTIVIAVAYLMGAFPTAYLVGRHLGRFDIRGVGSRNAGALNTYRQFGKMAGLAVLAMDTGKGASAIFLGQRLGVPGLVLYMAALAATLGHNFSPFVQFRGGKGAATVLGISAIMLWQITAVTAAVGAVIFAVTRHPVWSLTAVFVSLNVLTIATAQPIGQIVLCIGLSLLVAGTHLLRQYPQLRPLVGQRQWRRFMSVE